MSAPASSPNTIHVDTEIDTSNFDPSISEDERRFYIKAYHNIEMVRERKVHCTTCKMHIGTAPSQESIIKMHPVLRVTHCNKCHDFYNSGEFSKGEDGSELYCRWCGQGGEVYCCSNCPYVFCKSCIVKNLSRGVVADIEQNENWSCFNCAPKILWPLRAQHWALIKYIEKQKKAITSMNLAESEMKQQMAKDHSTCCRLAKAKCGNMSDSVESIDSLSRRSVSGTTAGSTGKKVQRISPRSQSPAPKRPKHNNDEVVCTPDLLSMLEPDCQITVSAKPRPSQSPVASSPKVMSIQNPSLYGGSTQTSTPKNTPPPLVLRNTSVQMRPVTPTPIVRRTVVGSRTPTAGGNSAPVYHTINGYRIDLNTASQQETFRLPNGKLIQVKRQGSTTTTHLHPQHSPASPQLHNSWQRNVNMQHTTRPVQIAPAQPHASQPYSQITIQQQQHAPSQHPAIIRYQNASMNNATVTALHNGTPAQLHVINGTHSTSVAQHSVVSQQQQQQPQHLQQPHQPQPQAIPQAAARPLMVRLVFPDTAIGQARSQLQEQVFNAMEICQHLTGKVQTLTNSNAYKQARNYLEVKELYIHLSYLLTYAIGRFKGLQDKCLGDMRQLGFVNDADSLENGQLAADKQASDDEDNEIEIVEPKTDTITLDSDNDDEDQPSTPSSTANKPPSQLSMALTAPPSSKANPQTTNSTVISQESEFFANAQTFLASMLEVDLSESDPNSALASPNGGAGGNSSGGDNTQKKQPRKKTTNKPNPTLLKQKEILHRERLEEMKRNDMKLKMKCTIELKKAEEEFPFAKDMLGEEMAEKAEEQFPFAKDILGEDELAEKADKAENINKKEDDNVEIEVLVVEDADSSLEEDASKAESSYEEKDTQEKGLTAEAIDECKADESINCKLETLETIKECCIALEKCHVPSEEEKKIQKIAEPLDELDNKNKEIAEEKEGTASEKTDESIANSKSTEPMDKEKVTNIETDGISKSEAKYNEMAEMTEEEEKEVEQCEKEVGTKNSLAIAVSKNIKEIEKVLERTCDKISNELESVTIQLTTEPSSPCAELLSNSDAEIDVDKEIAKLLQSRNNKLDNLDISENSEKDVATTSDLINDINELIDATNAMT